MNTSVEWSDYADGRRTVCRAPTEDEQNASARGQHGRLVASTWGLGEAYATEPAARLARGSSGG
jgi:hypothetical protein